MDITEPTGIEENTTLKETVEPENDLKNLLVEYVGEKLNPENLDITVEMIVEIVAKEFPEFLLAIAEENFIRGYQQALEDAEIGRKLFEEDMKRLADDKSE
jgi:hypothetical protein